MPVEDYYRDHGINRIIWTNCKRKQSKSIDELKDAIINELTANPRFNRTVKSEYQVSLIFITIGYNFVADHGCRDPKCWQIFANQCSADEQSWHQALRCC